MISVSSAGLGGTSSKWGQYGVWSIWRHPVRHVPAMPLTAGPSTIEPIVPIVAPLGAQGTPSVIQRAKPVVSTEQQTMQSTAVYGPLPYASQAMPSTAPLPYAAMPAMSARPYYPMGYYGQGNQFPLMPIA